MVVSYKKYPWIAMTVLAALIGFMMALTRECIAMVCCLHPGTSEGSLTFTIVAMALNVHQIQAIGSFLRDPRSSQRLHSQFLI